MPAKRVPTRRPVLVEVCVESVDDAVAAIEGGAGRIELNTALALDGLTPSPGLLLETRRRVKVPLVTMARPRAGDFAYSASEFRVLRRDVDFALEHGADGIAFGILTGDRRIDSRRCREIVTAVHGAKREVVFHRAFDAVAGPSESMETLIDLGVRRVMTSGGRPTALAGAAVIAALLRRAAGRIEILPAGGVRPPNVGAILSQTQCDQVHTSARDRTGRMSRIVLTRILRAVRRPPRR